MTPRPVVKPDSRSTPIPQDRKGRVLIVEDHVDARLVMEEFLETNGYTTSITKTVDEALALLRAGIQYDLVLLDLMLPGRGGMELLESIRQQPSPAGQLPVFVVSAFAPPTIEGADGVLHKPVDLSRLLDTVERVVAALPRSGER